MFLKIVSGAHKHLAPIESCVAILKTTLASMNRRLTSPLDVYQWSYVFRLTEKVVLTRPLAASKSGRLWTPACLLKMMGQGQNDNIADFRPQASSDVVINQLQSFEEKMAKIRREVAFIILDTLIYPSFFEKLTSDEKVKKRTKSSQVRLSDIFLCPILFAKTFNTAKSMLRLVYINDAGTGGIFTKTGKPRKDRLVSRDFSYLYYICEGTRDSILSDRWRPTFKLSKILENVGPDESLNFEEPQREEIEKQRDSPPDVDLEYDTFMGNGPQSWVADGAVEGGEEDDGGREEETEGSDTGENIFFSRFGRRLKKTEFFGV